MKEINKIKELLNEVNNLIIKNIDNAHNIDLEHMSQRIEDMIDDLVEIEDFKVYDEE
jgi:hypothetical protein